MQIIISPAKTMKVDNDTLGAKRLPIFLEQAETIRSVLRSFNIEELQQLYRVSESIAKLNYERFQTMDLTKNVSPAVFAYEGIQYQYMAPDILELKQLDYLDEHLHILSGFYGILNAFDGVVPYRLEMQAKLKIGEYKNLYEFWGSKIAEYLSSKSEVILNLASEEYSKAVRRHLPKSARFITCVFGERKGDKIIEKGTMCKMARGEMVRYLAVNEITDPAGVKEFRSSNYRYSVKDSDDNRFVFIKE